MSNLWLDVGQAQELKLAFRRHGWNNSLIKRLCETDVLGDVLGILRGDARVVPIRRVIDLNTPVLKDGDVVVKHLKQGKCPWDEIRLAIMDPRDLHYTWDDVPRKWQEGINPSTLRRRSMMPWFLRFQRPANICLRDYLLANQHLIPWEWGFGSEPILFWGTILKSERGLYVPGMTKDFGTWEIYNRRIEERYEWEKSGSNFTTYNNPCIVFAPKPSF